MIIGGCSSRDHRASSFRSPAHFKSADGAVFGTDAIPSLPAYLQAEDACHVHPDITVYEVPQWKPGPFPACLKHQGPRKKHKGIVWLYQSMQSCSGFLCDNRHLGHSEKRRAAPLKMKTNSPRAKSDRKERFLYLLELHILSYCCLNVYLNNENTGSAGLHLPDSFF